MARSIERYLRMMPKASGLRCSENFWYPAADVYRTAEGWVVKLELAGVGPDGVREAGAGGRAARRVAGQNLGRHAARLRHAPRRDVDRDGLISPARNHLQPLREDYPLSLPRRGRARRAPLPRRPPHPLHPQPRRVRLKSETRELSLSNL